MDACFRSRIKPEVMKMNIYILCYESLVWGTRDSQWSRHNNTNESLASRRRFVDLIYRYDDQTVRFRIYTNNVYVYARGHKTGQTTR